MFDSGDFTHYVVALGLGDQPSADLGEIRVFQATDTAPCTSGHAQVGFDRRIVGISTR